MSFPANTKEVLKSLSFAAHQSPIILHYLQRVPDPAKNYRAIAWPVIQQVVFPPHRKSTSLWRGTAEQTHATSFHKCRLRKRSCRSVNWREGKGKGKGNQMWYVMTHSEVGRLFREWWCEELDAWWEEQKMWWAWVLVVVYCMKLKREIMKNKDGLLTITDARLFEYMYHGCLQWLATKGTRYRS